MGRGRKPILENRWTTTINLEDRHREYIHKYNLELSTYVRDLLDILIQNEEDPIEQTKRIIQEKKDIKREAETEIAQLEKYLQNQLAKQESTKLEEQKEVEFENQRKDYVIRYIQNLRYGQRCTGLWLAHMKDAWKLDTLDKVKSYVKTVCKEEGIPDKAVKSFFG